MDVKQSVRILLVDNDRDILDALGVLCEMDGAQVGYACDYYKALERLESEPYDIVVADYQMPRMHGLYLLDMIKDRYPDMPVIIMSAYWNEKRLEDARRRKADLTLLKPFEYEELLDGIRKLMAKKWKKPGRPPSGERL